MAIIDPGQIGDFNGKIGRVVVAPYRNLTVGRKAPKKSTVDPSPEQTNQRAVFLLVISFLKEIKQTIKIGYPKTGNLSGMNAAVQYHLMNAITGVTPNRTFDLTKVVLSKGSFRNVFDPQMIGVTGNSMSVTWELDSIDGDGTSATDKVYIVFCDPALLSTVTSSAVAQRSALSATVKMPRSFIGASVHAWIFVISADGLSVSKSLYLGLKPVIA